MTRHQCHEASLIINVNKIRLQRQANTLRAHTGTIHPYVWFQGQCKRPYALLGTFVKHLHFEDSHLKTLNSRLSSSPKGLIHESRATTNRCTYVVPLFDQFGEKALSNFMTEYLVVEI
jgi:hypothetical protein